MAKITPISALLSNLKLLPLIYEAENDNAIKPKIANIIPNIDNLFNFVPKNLTESIITIIGEKLARTEPYAEPAYKIEAVVKVKPNGPPKIEPITQNQKAFLFLKLSFKKFITFLLILINIKNNKQKSLNIEATTEYNNTFANGILCLNPSIKTNPKSKISKHESNEYNIGDITPCNIPFFSF
jgi:hypothetical protein